MALLRSEIRQEAAGGRDGGRVAAGAGGDFLEQFFGLDVPVTMQRQVPTVPLRWRAPDQVHRQSGGLSCCAAETCTHSTKLCR